MTRPDDAGHAAPKSLGAVPHTVSGYLCIDFVNSRFADHTGSDRFYDRLDLDEWRRWFLSRAGLPSQLRFGARPRRELTSLRDLIRRLLEAGRAPGERVVAELNRYLDRTTLSWELIKTGTELDLALRWNSQRWAALMAAVVESYARLLVEGHIERVRVCANPACSFMFYDESRNGSRRWCDVTVCGNLIKVRRHRAAQH
jgi:predicted RNA-binding Zn ribbon-like protein